MNLKIGDELRRNTDGRIYVVEDIKRVEEYRIVVFGRGKYDNASFNLYLSDVEKEFTLVESENTGGDMQTFSTGAKRGTDVDDRKIRYDLITPIGLRKLAETYAEGAAKYGADNWKKGLPKSNLLNHAMNHIEQYRNGDKTEEHLAHAVWNLLTIIHFDNDQAGWPEGCEKL